MACCICPLIEKMCPGDRVHLPEMSPNSMFFDQIKQRRCAVLTEMLLFEALENNAEFLISVN